VVAAPTAAAAAPGIGALPSGAARSASGPSANAGTTAQLAPAGDIIYTAQLTVRAANVGSAAARATQITEGVGGYVSNETTSADPDHPSEATATVQLKIPVASYPATLGQLAGGLGTQLSLQEQAQDVTQQVADVNSQVASDQAAIVQLRVLLAHAGSVNDLLNVQDQINNEESTLEAMQAQQRALSHDGDPHHPRPEGQAGCAPSEGAAVPGWRPWRRLARAPGHAVLDPGLPRGRRALRRHRGHRRLRDLPGQALDAPPQARIAPGRTGKLGPGAGPGRRRTALGFVAHWKP
jgi:hypothetical protein